MACTVTVLHLRKFLDEVSTHLHHYRKYLHCLDSHKGRFIACIPFTIEGHEDDFTIYMCIEMAVYLSSRFYRDT
jgi:hypothetical protein